MFQRHYVSIWTVLWLCRYLRWVYLNRFYRRINGKVRIACTLLDILHVGCMHSPYIIAASYLECNAFIQWRNAIYHDYID